MELIVLDLDETLWYATYENLPQPADCIYKGRNVYFRPFARECIAEISKQVEVAVWTSAKAHYAKYVLKKLMGDLSLFRFIKTRKDCEKKQMWNQFSYETVYIKNLENLGDAYLIDDRFDCVIPAERCLRIAPFTGNLEDSALKEMLEEVIKMIENEK